MKKRSTKTRLSIKSYYYLTKPGIIRGNLITAAAGYLFGAYGNGSLSLFIGTMLGIGLLIASACVLNNYIDREIDAKMARTKSRALASGLIAPKNAFIFAGILGVSAFAFLIYFANWLTVLLGAIAIVNYVVIYGAAKRRSVHGTLVGSISGALPVMAGYVAGAGSFDQGAVLLFLVLVFWQMPHFYAIAIYRIKDYEAAKLPVLPIVRGIGHAKYQMFIYSLWFVVATTLLAAQGYAGKTYLVIISLVGFLWLLQILRGFSVQDDQKWARQVFSSSLGILLIFNLLISIDNFLL